MSEEGRVNRRNGETVSWSVGENQKSDEYRKMSERQVKTETEW